MKKTSIKRSTITVQLLKELDYQQDESWESKGPLPIPPPQEIAGLNKALLGDDGG